MEEVSQAGDYRTSEDVSSSPQIKSNDRAETKRLMGKKAWLIVIRMHQSDRHRSASNRVNTLSKLNEPAIPKSYLQDSRIFSLLTIFIQE